MNLLPKSKHEFTTIEYWNKFYKNRGKEAFEWYGEFPELCTHLHKYVKPKDNILMVGCGNSTLSNDLYDVGFHTITNIDISPVVIKQMSDDSKSKGRDMQYVKMDATSMTFDDETFTVVIDKGTTDALMQDDSPETLDVILKLFREIQRVLKYNGRFICISLLQEHLLKALVAFFATPGWMLRIVRNFETETTKTDVQLPVFVVVCTKVKPSLCVMEVNLSGGSLERVQTGADVISAVKEVHHSTLLCLGLTQSTIVNGDEVSIDLCKPGDETPRLTIYMQDNVFAKSNGSYAAFIVPQGRESDWLFSTLQGRKELAQTAMYGRLAVVHLHRDHDFGDWDSVCAELSPTIKKFKPPGCKNESIRFLSLGTDVGKRTVRHRGVSDVSGPYVIEDVYDKDDVFRRLIFLDNPKAIQSEVRLKAVKIKNRKEQLIVDNTFVTSQHHLYMLTGINLALLAQTKSNLNSPTSKPFTTLLIGFGGGTLCTFILKALGQIRLTAVDIDKEMVKIAEDWFDFRGNDRLDVVIDDGIKYLKDTVDKDKNFDVIIFDIDGKDPSIGMTSPPKQFVDDSVLADVKRTLTENGIFILNLACRNNDLKSVVIQKLRATFTTVASYKIEQDINEIVYCSDNAYNWVSDLRESTVRLNKVLKKVNKLDYNVIETDEFLAKLTLNT